VEKMYDNVNNNQTIEYDPKIISKIKEMIKEGFEKLKNIIITMKNSNYDIYYEVKRVLNKISNKLINIDSFKNEYKYLILLKNEILHIIYKNCEDSSFGHCSFALELMDFFIEIWNAKINLVENYSKAQLKKYEDLQNSFKKRYREYRHEFYTNIYELSEDYSEEELYDIHASLRG
jgi:hypothetical protein